MQTSLVAAQKASGQQTRLHNRRLVLQTIASFGETSRAAIARKTNLTPPAVSSLVSELAATGIIEERGRSEEATLGKPPQLVGIASGHYEIACVDISGRHLRGAVLDLDGTISTEVTGEPSNLIGEAAIAATERIAGELLAMTSAPAQRLCVATPGVVDSAGVVRRASYFDWENVDLAGRLERRFGTETHVVNDGQALALAEFARLPEPVQNFVAVRVARGVSAGIILHGAPYLGDGFGAGEIGFLLPSTSSTDTPHSSPISLPRLISLLAPDLSENIELDLADAIARTDSAVVADIGHVVGARLGDALAAIIGVLDVHNVRIDSSIAGFGQPLLDAAMETISTAVVDSLASEIDLRFGDTGVDAVLRGAGLAVTHQDLGLIT